MIYTAHHASTLQTFGEFQPTALDQSGLGADETDRDWLVCPVSIQPKIASHLDESNWEAQCAALEQADRYVRRARRHVRHKLIQHVRQRPNRPLARFAQDMCNGTYLVGSGPDYINRLCDLVDLPPISGETVASFAARLDSALESDGDYTTHYFGHWTSDFKIAIVRPGSKAHRVAVELEMSLADYPVLDDMDLSRRECESMYESVLNELSRLEIESKGEPLSDEALNDLADAMTCGDQRQRRKTATRLPFAAVKTALRMT
jgi:hypothetical protein